MLEFNVGDLVSYINDAYPTEDSVGLVLKVDPPSYEVFSRIKVRWTDHLDSNRDWYREDELEIISESR